MLQGFLQASALDHTAAALLDAALFQPLLYSGQLRSTAGDFQICNEWIAELYENVGSCAVVAPRALFFSCVLVPVVHGTDAVAFGRLFWWSVMRRARTG